MGVITLPYKFDPRPYQLPFLRAFDSGKYDRFIQLWHRRSGKDKLDLNLVAREMQKHVGIYYYFYPTYSQGKKALWSNIGKDGVPYIDHFPTELVDSKNETEMRIKYKNGSIFQVIGTDDIDRVVGTNPRGVIFSEYSLQNPKAWEFIRPILLENGGWAIFNFTPRGKNHAFDLYERNKVNDSWFVQKLTIADTGVLDEADMEEERKAGMTEDMIQQEYYCSFTAAIQGSYYGHVYEEAEQANRFSNVPYDPSLPVYTVWDLGIGDSMAIGFWQLSGMEARLIDYLEATGEGLPWYAQQIQQRGYTYGDHYAPHDIKVRELGTGKSRLETAKGLGINFKVVESLPVQDGIDAGRALFKKAWIDKTKCADFLRLIPQYTKEWDEDNKCFKNKPLHDWTSHGADMWRYSAIVIRKMGGSGMARTFYPSSAPVLATPTQLVKEPVSGGRVRYPQQMSRGYQLPK